jgi:hypothetical protein
MNRNGDICPYNYLEANMGVQQGDKTCRLLETRVNFERDRFFATSKELIEAEKRIAKLEDKEQWTCVPHQNIDQPARCPWCWVDQLMEGVSELIKTINQSCNNALDLGYCDISDCANCDSMKAVNKWKSQSKHTEMGTEK